MRICFCLLFEFTRFLFLLTASLIWSLRYRFFIFLCSVKMRARHLIACFVICLLDCRGVLSEIPNCAFEDTVNLTAGQKFSDGSYAYGDLLVPPHLIGYYDYIELFGGERKLVEKHLRGCACQLKRCVKFCCHPRAKMRRSAKNSAAKCDAKLKKKIRYSPFLNITLHNGTQRAMNVLTEFVVQKGIPCENGEMLMPHLNNADRWQLYAVDIRVKRET